MVVRDTYSLFESFRELLSGLEVLSVRFPLVDVPEQLREAVGVPASATELTKD